AAPLLAPIRRQPRERASQVEIGELQEARERHAVISLSVNVEPGRTGQEPSRAPGGQGAPTAPRAAGRRAETRQATAREGRPAMPACVTRVRPCATGTFRPVAPCRVTRYITSVPVRSR